MALGMEVGLCASHIVLDGDPAPLPKNGTEPPIFGPFYCRQTAGWINMALGMDVGLSPGDFVLDGDPASPPVKWHSPPIFGQYPLWPNNWMDSDGTWHGGRPRPRRLCIR